LDAFISTFNTRLSLVATVTRAQIDPDRLLFTTDSIQLNKAVEGKRVIKEIRFDNWRSHGQQPPEALARRGGCCALIARAVLASMQVPYHAAAGS
jgi:hypothetical protein